MIMGNQEQRIPPHRHSGNWGVYLILILILIALVWMIKLGYDQRTVLKDLHACCENAVKPVTPPGDGPGPGPIITVGPKQLGSNTVTDWQIGAVGASRSVVFDTNNRLRVDVQGTKRLFKGKSSGSPTILDLNKLIVNLTNGDVVKVEKTAANKLEWTLNGQDVEDCDYDEDPTIPRCEGDGIPASFDGVLKEIPFETNPAIENLERGQMQTE
jgi:hypothetical protein